MNCPDEQVARAFFESIRDNISRVHLERIEEVARAATDAVRRLAAKIQKLFEEVRPQLEVLLVKTAEGLVRTVDYWEAQPASLGIEPLLVSKGMHPLVSRLFAHLIAKLSRQIAAMLKLESQVVLNIRRIAKSRNVGLAFRRAAPVFLSPDAPELQGRIFEPHGIHFDDFLAQFRLAVAGDRIAQSRAREMAIALAPHLKRLPGPKPSAASIAREHMEGFGALFANFARYTYDPIAADFSDPITVALRKEFTEPRFDPRPAYRRSLARTAVA